MMNDYKHLIYLTLLLTDCSSEEIGDRLNGLPSDDRINAAYEHASKSAPESLKQYYDPELTKSLNQ